MTACRRALQGRFSDMKHRVQCFGKRWGHSCHFQAPELRTMLDRRPILYQNQKQKIVLFCYFQMPQRLFRQKQTNKKISFMFDLVSFLLVVCNFSVLFLLCGPNLSYYKFFPCKCIVDPQCQNQFISDMKLQLHTWPEFDDTIVWYWIPFGLAWAGLCSETHDNCVKDR